MPGTSAIGPKALNRELNRLRDQLIEAKDAHWRNAAELAAAEMRELGTKAELERALADIAELRTPAVLTTGAGPMTDAERVAASNAATRELLASRASLTRAVPAPAPTAAEAPIGSPAAATPQASGVPATLLVATAEPTVNPKPVAIEPVAEPTPAAVPPSAAQALADAAKALAAAAAAMQSVTR